MVSLLRSVLILLGWVLPPAILAQEAEDIYSPKLIALTYDDAPRGDDAVFTGAERTQAIINQLAQADTGPVAFFVTTRGFSRPDDNARIQAYSDAGHLIANHSDTHPWASRTDVSDYLDDIDAAASHLRDFDNLRPWFRFPYLDEGQYGQDKTAATLKRDQLRKALEQRGLSNGYVTVDMFDWHLEELWQEAIKSGHDTNHSALSKLYVDMIVDAAEYYDAMSIDVLVRRPVQVLLLHENDLAGTFTVDVVAALRKAGWTIVSPDLAYADPINDNIPETLFLGAGRIAAIARESGKDNADYFQLWSTNRKDIETRVANAGIFTK